VTNLLIIRPFAKRTTVREENEMTNEFRGSYTVTITPFTEDGSAIDEEAWKRFLDWQLDVGVPGIIVLGSTGEFLSVSDEERTHLVETAVDHVAGRVPVLVGTMNAHTPNAVRYSREAEALGADGLMIVPPYYFTPTEDEIFEYYRAIAEAVSLPIMLYNNPVTTNVDMSAKLVGRLTRAFGNIRYIKEASLDVARVYDVIEETDSVMNVFAGERIVESFLLGAVGYVNPYGNYIPRASHRIWDYLVEGRIDDAKNIERLIDRIDHIIAAGHPTYGHQCYSKALAAVAGCPVGDVRPPLTTFKALGEEGRARVAEIQEHMRELDELVETLDAAHPVAV
jgi:4-hydroxy-tetrahydrodipicolinate synthase